MEIYNITKLNIFYFFYILKLILFLFKKWMILKENLGIIDEWSKKESGKLITRAPYAVDSFFLLSKFFFI